MKKSLISYLIKKGLTSSQAAERLGVSKKLVTRWAKRHELRFPYRKGTPGILQKSTVKVLLKRGYRNIDIDDLFKVKRGTTQVFRTRNNLKYKSGIPYYIKGQNLDNHFKSIVIGTVLGDSYIHPSGYLVCTHSLKQKNYCEWKANSLGSTLKIDKPRFDKRTKKIYYSCSFSTKKYQYLKFLRNELYNPNKQLTKKSLKYYNNLSLAVHFMDNGSKTKHSYRLATNSFTIKSLQIFNQHCLKHFGIYFTVHNKNKLYLPKKFKNIFEKLIKAYIHPELKYKLH